MTACCPRTAVISDIHGNIDALTEVLKDIRKLGVKYIVCLGDIVGYGGAPEECVKAIVDNCEATVMGNHEAMTIFDDIVYLEEMPSRIKRPIEVARDALSREEMIWLQELPLIAESDVISIVHSSFSNPSEFPYVFQPEEAKRLLDAQHSDVSFHGHSHVPLIWEDRGTGLRSYRPQLASVRLAKERRYSINPGSVGQPRDGDPRASYVIYDGNTRDVTFRRVPYDIEAACRRIEAAKIPLKNAERLRRGE